MESRDRHHLLFVLGTRPEAIKMAPVILGAKQQPDVFEVTVCFTGQHREMAPQVAAFFGIEPDVTLDVMRPNQDLAGLTGRLLTGITEIIRKRRPSHLLVQGDTTTVLAGALAAYYERVPIVGHIEAGLRTGDKSQPFPEEINRVLTSGLADIHFAPTERSRGALLAEGIHPGKVHVTGNTVIDALYLAIEKLDEQNWPLSRSTDNLPEPLQEAIKSGARNTAARLNNPDACLGEPAEPIVLITGHRRENFGDGMQQICSALKRLASGHPDAHFIYPVHLNPNVQKPVFEMLGDLPNLHLIDPLPYPDFVTLMAASSLIITDSGGVQEEAPALGKPVLVMRNKTERPEAVETGSVILVGAEEQPLFEQANRLLSDFTQLAAISKIVHPYGDGKATPRILEALNAAQLNQYAPN